METIEFDTSNLRPVGTVFVRRGKAKTVCTIIGYHIVFDTDTQATKITYRASHKFCGQIMIDDYPAATIEMGLAAMAGSNCRVAS